MGKSGLLLHVCCAPCAAGCVERLIAEDREVTLYFSNSNIATEEEFARRLVSVEALARIFRLPLEVDPYDHAAWNASPGWRRSRRRGRAARSVSAFRWSGPPGGPRNWASGLRPH